MTFINLTHSRFFFFFFVQVLASPQSTTSRTPSAFAGASLSLAPNASATISIIYGHADTLEAFLANIVPKLTQAGFVTGSRAAAQALTTLMSDRVAMTSGVPLMDNYVKQNYLDNALRGGMPFTLGGKGADGKSKIYHAFSRIHGDLERDYNNFVIERTYFSQGPGNFRDVNQGGFWTDHWTYTLDLVHNFVSVYPDEKEHMLFDSEPIPFFFSNGKVVPRAEKYMLSDNSGTVRQYDAVIEPEDKRMWSDPSYVGDEHGGGMWQRDAQGEVFRVSIVAKMVLLAR
ncbi:hypothetical protein T492DRAFT_1123635 [Pavlovales sp. CCMP2436]|nr:hypothetical protein T492DRAFT_1123635 [Pavlovales sp. CCMP2436]